MDKENDIEVSRYLHFLHPEANTIRETIENAVKNKDRYVSLFFNENGICMYVYPYEKTLHKWERISSGKYRCSECGSEFDFDSPYCPRCGEQLGRSDS